MEIAQRHTLFSKHEKVSLNESGIARTRGNKTTKEIRFADIKSIQLLCEGFSTAHQKVVYQCVVRSARHKLQFSNALFQDPQPGMDDQYRRFIQQLHNKMQPHAETTSCIKGSNVYYALGWFVLIMGGLLTAMFPLALVFALLTGNDIIPLVRKSWAIAILPLGVLGVALPLIRLGKQANYDLNLVPPEFLPKQ